MSTSLVEIKKEIELQLQDKETLKTLLMTTFNGLTPETAKVALLEGMMRGFSFQDFLEKNLYVIPFKDKYSLVTSIDYMRKIGMRSGIVGKDAPIFEEKEGKLFSCTVTVKKKVSDVVGNFTATVFFHEFNTGRNQWVTKPHTMLCKVAEMHALRMACPEELSKGYIEEEIQQETEEKKVDIELWATRLNETKSLEDLKVVWADMPAEAKKQLTETKEAIKLKYASAKV